MNKARCLNCDTVIESNPGLMFCNCWDEKLGDDNPGHGIDGGEDYQRIIGDINTVVVYNDNGKEEFIRNGG